MTTPEAEKQAPHAEFRAPPAELLDMAQQSVPVEDQALSHSTVVLPTGHRTFLWSVHSYLNDYIRFADAKSGVALGFAAASLGAVYSTGRLTELTDTPGEAWSVFDKWLVAAVLLLILGAVAAAWGIRPRLDSRQPKGFIFWESVRAHGSPGDFHHALSRQSDDDLDRQLAEHVHMLASIASRKYYWTSWAVLLTLLGCLLSGALIVLK